MRPEDAVKIEGYGCYVWEHEGYLLGCEAGEFEAHGGHDDRYAYDISAPESQAFLDKVNAALGTNFRFEDFAGR